MLRTLCSMSFTYLGVVFVNCQFGVTFFAGGTLAVSFRPREKVSIDVHQAFVLTAFAWIIITLFAALPLSASSAGISYTDAVFEAMSGVTGTGGGGPGGCSRCRGGRGGESSGRRRRSIGAGDDSR